jgi:hypothetical protein
MLSGRKEGRPGRQAGRTRRKTDRSSRYAKSAFRTRWILGRKAGHIREKNRPLLKGRQDAGKHTYMQDIQAGMKLNRQVDSSHAGRLPYGKAGGQKGRHKKQAY